MGRWQRASRLLTAPGGEPVLDLGCAFGFGTRMLAGRYQVHGHDLDAGYIERARRSVPAATFSVGRAHRVPVDDDAFEAVVLLDVLEHVPDDAAVIEEIVRVLRPGGQLILSVPNAGVLARWDSLNVYQRIRRTSWPDPTDDPSWKRRPEHRHYSIRDLHDLLDPWFDIEQIEYTGLGLAEPLNLALLLVFRGLVDLPRAYRVLQYLYFVVYLVEDAVGAGSWGYHLTLAARRRETDSATER